ncbi:MAG: ABC transporter ATP-binding protein [Lachnospiraceae bacterium]|nr:ABC transporter ATP-binding protein [Lachnospiraceae bacterium]
MNKTTHGTHGRLISFFGEIYSDQKSHFIIAVVREFIISIKPFISLIVVKLVIDMMVNHDETILCLLYAVFTYIGAFFIDLIEAKTNSVCGEFEQKIMDQIVFEKNKSFLNLDLGTFESEEIQSLMSEMTYLESHGTSAVHKLIVLPSRIVANIISTAVILCVVVRLFFHSAQGGEHYINITFVFVTVVISIASHVLFVKFLKKSTEFIENDGQAKMKRIAAVSDYIYDIHSGADIRYYNECLVTQGSDEIRKLSKEVYNCFWNNIAKASSFSTIGNAIVFMFVYGFVAEKALRSRVSMGNVFLYAGLLNSVYGKVSSIVKDHATLIGGDEYLKRRQKIDGLLMESASRRRTSGLTESLSEQKDGVIEFRNVYFRYNDDTEYILENITFFLDIHKMTVIVGLNGAGKSTIIKLLMRLYKPTKGHIYYCGQDIFSLTKEQYFNVVSVVFQQEKPLSFSVREIIDPNEYYEDRVILDTLSAVNGNNKKTNELTLDTYVFSEYETHGREISGGEIQKILLARAMINKSCFMILDEPSAAMDAKAEKEFNDLMYNEKNSRGMLIVSHRLSICVSCDKVIVLDKGRMVQEGKHDSLLLDKNGLYYELWTTQLELYK